MYCSDTFAFRDVLAFDPERAVRGDLVVERTRPQVIDHLIEIGMSDAVLMAVFPALFTTHLHEPRMIRGSRPVSHGSLAFRQSRYGYIEKYKQAAAA